MVAAVERTEERYSPASLTAAWKVLARRAGRDEEEISQLQSDGTAGPFPALSETAVGAYVDGASAREAGVPDAGGLTATEAGRPGHEQPPAVPRPDAAVTRALRDALAGAQARGELAAVNRATALKKAGTPARRRLLAKRFNRQRWAQEKKLGRLGKSLWHQAISGDEAARERLAGFREFDVQWSGEPGRGLSRDRRNAFRHGLKTYFDITLEGGEPEPSYDRRPAEALDARSKVEPAVQPSEPAGAAAPEVALPQSDAQRGPEAGRPEMDAASGLNEARPLDGYALARAALLAGAYEAEGRARSLLEGGRSPPGVQRLIAGRLAWELRRDMALLENARTPGGLAMADLDAKVPLLRTSWSWATVSADMRVAAGRLGDDLRMTHGIDVGDPPVTARLDAAAGRELRAHMTSTGVTPGGAPLQQDLIQASRILGHQAGQARIRSLVAATRAGEPVLAARRAGVVEELQRDVAELKSIRSADGWPHATSARDQAKAWR
ncbi:MAG: hypothetical protein ACRDSN_04220, partial [Pseudonocardiaceae bacterium]